MEREHETNSSHYALSRTSIWCPVCGAAENRACTVVKGIRFDSHNAYASGTVPRPVIMPEQWENPLRQGVHQRHKYQQSAPARTPSVDKEKWTPNGWVQ